jgi:hypothetical protein
MTESLTSSICKLADAMVMSDSLGADKFLCNVGFSVGSRQNLSWPKIFTKCSENFS